MARSIIGGCFIELFVNASLETCIERDPKGLYKKALAGEMSNLIGLGESNPYEVPEAPDIEIKTAALGIEQCADKIMNFFETA